MNSQAETLDKNQQEYRDYFGVVDKYLIQCYVNPDWKEGEKKDGYIVFIDFENDLDYIDFRRHDADIEKQINRHIAKLQLAEAVPTKHLPEHVQMEFKRSLGVGYIHVLNLEFEDIPGIISTAREYLRERSKEYSRKLFLGSGIPAAITALLIGCWLYLSDYRNPWMFGIIFSVLGGFASVWVRYGKVDNSGYGGFWLHGLECYARMIVGMIFSIMAMVAIRCRLVFPAMDEKDTLYAFIIASFVAAFSERLVPSILERLETNVDVKCI